MSTDDTKKGTKSTKPAARGRKPSEKTASQSADGEVKAAGTPPRKKAAKTAAGTAGSKKAATTGTSKAASRTTKAAETSKPVSRKKTAETSKSGTAGAGRGKASAGQKKEGAKPRETRRKQPDNIVQFPGATGRAPKKAKSAPRRGPAVIGKANRDTGVEGIPVEDAVPQALEAAYVLAEEVGDMIGQVVNMALAMQSMPTIPGAHEGNDIDTLCDVLMGLLDRAVVKIRAMALLAPPPRLLDRMLEEQPEGYDRLQATSTAQGDRLESILMQVYDTAVSQEDRQSAVDLLTSEEIMDALDEVSEEVVEQGDLLHDMAEDAYLHID